MRRGVTHTLWDNEDGRELQIKWVDVSFPGGEWNEFYTVHNAIGVFESQA